MIQNTNETVNKPSTDNEKIPDLTNIINDVKVWKMFNGVITEVMVKWGPLAIREDYPKNLDPVEVIKNYLRVIDPEKTKIIQKLSQAPASGGLVARSKRARGKTSINPRNMETEPRIAFINNVSIYQKYIVMLYRRLPEKFNMVHISEFFMNEFNLRSDSTGKNKATAYLSYMKNNGFVEWVGKADKKNHYKFTNPPFGAELPAQAVFDADLAQKQKLLELETMRRTL